jgi:hypothetical protein
MHTPSPAVGRRLRDPGLRASASFPDAPDRFMRTWPAARTPSIVFALCFGCVHCMCGNSLVRRAEVLPFDRAIIAAETQSMVSIVVLA